MRSRVAVSGVSRIQLVAAGDHLQTLVLEELVEQHQIEVAGNCEVVRHPEVDQTRGDVVAESPVRLGVLTRRGKKDVGVAIAEHSHWAACRCFVMEPGHG